MKRRITSFLVSILFILTIYFREYLYQEFWIFSIAIVLLPIIGIILVIFLNIKRDKKALYISLSAFLIGLIYLTYHQTELFKSKIIMKATLVDDLSSLHLTLRENKTFELIPESFLGKGEPFEGKYILEGDSIIFLDRPYDNDFIGDTVHIEGSKIILRYNPNGHPDTAFANYFRIDLFDL